MPPRVHIERVLPMEFAALHSGAQRVYFVPEAASYAIDDVIRFREYEDPFLEDDPTTGAQIRDLQRIQPTGRTYEAIITHVFSQHSQYLQPGISALSLRHNHARSVLPISIRSALCEPATVSFGH